MCVVCVLVRQIDGRQIRINPERLRGEIGRKRGVTFDANNNGVKVSIADEAEHDEKNVNFIRLISTSFAWKRGYGSWCRNRHA